MTISHDDGPGDDIIAIDALKSNTVDLTIPVRALRANAAGTIKVTMPGTDGAGVARTLNFLAGETRVGLFLRVWDTGTTATGIEGHV